MLIILTIEILAIALNTLIDYTVYKIAVMSTENEFHFNHSHDSVMIWQWLCLHSPMTQNEQQNDLMPLAVVN